MSTAKRQRRFGYLNQQEAVQPAPPETERQSQETVSGERLEGSTHHPQQIDGGGEATAPARRAEGEAHGIPQQTLSSVPKGRGRMSQERSQLNVRIPTALKRQASSKAVLEGRDIGEVVEELLREYLQK